MRRLFPLLFIACSTSSIPDASLTLDARAPVPDAGAPDADPAPDAVGAPDADPPDGGDPEAYRAAILGATWTRLANAPAIRGKQDDVFFVDPQEGFSVNGEGRIFHTVDGGDQWERLVERPGTFFRSILMLGRERGFAGNIGTGYFPGVTDSSPLFETRDGRTWTVVDRITGPAVTGICNMHRLDDQHLFAVGRVGGPCFMITSSDGGESWRSRDLNGVLSMLIDVRFTSPTDGLIVGQDSEARCKILRTRDGGETWSAVFQSRIPQTLCWKISFPSEAVGYVSIQGGSRSTFAKTTDGGDTWEELTLLPGRAFRGLGAGFITEDIGWMANEVGAWRTTDGGATWEQDASLGPAINRFRFVDRHTAYAIGTTIYKLSVPRQ